MAQSSWPSPDNSRIVNDSQYERLGISYGPVAGLIGTPSLSALVYGDSTGLQVKIRADRYGIVRGFEWWSGSSEFTKTIASNSSGQTRTDLVVLRLSRSTWNVSVEVVQGTPGAGAPALTQNTGSTGVWELPLAVVTVTSGAGTITAGNVVFVAPYLNADGSGYSVSSTTALAYIPTPSYGQQVAVSGDTTRHRYTGSGWEKAERRRRFTVTANSPQNATASPASITDLAMPVEANKRYLVEARVYYDGPNGNNVGEVQWRWSFPALAKWEAWANHSPAYYIASNYTGDANFQGYANDVTPNSAYVLLGTSVGVQLAIIAGTFVTGANAGNLTPTFCQNLANAVPAIVYIGTSCTIEEV